MRQFILGFIFLVAAGIGLATDLEKRPEVQLFADEMQEKGFERAKVLALFAKTKSNPDIIAKISKPAESLSWQQYQKIFIQPKRISEGAEFWRQHKAELAAIESQYKVPAEYIVAIIGVESFFGQHKGQYPVMEALSTLAFDYEPRAKFFRKELQEFLLMSKEQDLDPLAIKGSYAGAMGFPQFIPSAYRNFAVSYQKNKKVDLINDIDTAMASVANYFVKHGWKSGEPVVHKAKIINTKYKTLKTERAAPRPSIKAEALSSYGIKPVAKLDKTTKVAPLILTEPKAGKGNCFLGRDNFYVITRYNHSTLYAMAVHDLAQSIKTKKNTKKKS